MVVIENDYENPFNAFYFHARIYFFFLKKKNNTSIWEPWISLKIIFVHILFQSLLFCHFHNNMNEYFIFKLFYDIDNVYIIKIIV